MIQCTFENERGAFLRHVTVGVIVVNQQNKVLLLMRSPKIWNGNKYTIPGGFLDRDENTKQGALRELQEETGLKGENVILFRINDNPKRPKEDRQNVDVIYIVKKVSGEIKTQEEEVASARWFSENELPNDSEFAFDHRDSILKYFDYLKKPFALPIVG